MSDEKSRELGAFRSGDFQVMIRISKNGQTHAVYVDHDFLCWIDRIEIVTAAVAAWIDDDPLLVAYLLGNILQTAPR